jgi:hypothetical protein
LQIVVLDKLDYCSSVKNLEEFTGKNYKVCLKLVSSRVRETPLRKLNNRPTSPAYLLVDSVKNKG